MDRLEAFQSLRVKSRHYILLELRILKLSFVASSSATSTRSSFVTHSLSLFRRSRSRGKVGTTKRFRGRPVRMRNEFALPAVRRKFFNDSTVEVRLDALPRHSDLQRTSPPSSCKVEAQQHRRQPRVDQAAKGKACQDEGFEYATPAAGVKNVSFPAQ